MEVNISNLIHSKDYKGLREALAINPNLANEDIGLETEENKKAHPLHRLGDAVFTKKISEEEAIALATIFLEFGSAINGIELAENQDSPLTAAVSFYAENLALFYIEKGADIHHKGCHGGTALHWAAWCGSKTVLKKLIDLGANINQLCTKFQSTPLLWAVHGIAFGGAQNQHQQEECVKLLLGHGADKSIPNIEGYLPIEFLKEEQKDLLS
jgi:ankyrin repeat protein